MKKTKTKTREPLPESFAELCGFHMLRPITDKVSYENAQEIIDRLAILKKRTKDQDEYLESLSILFEAYEDEHYPIDTSHITPIEMLKYLMENREMNASDLGRLLGDRSLGSRVLSGNRELSKAHIRILAEHFSVSPALFI